MLSALIQQYTDALQKAGVTAPFTDWAAFSPATDAELATLAAETGCTLPDDLVAWLSSMCRELPFAGNYSAQRTGRIIQEIQGSKGIDFSRHFANVCSWGDRRYGDGKLAQTYWQPQWVTIAQDGCGNAYCYDLAPGPAGRVGQLIAMEFQDGQGPYLSQWASLEAMLRDHIGRMEQGAYTVDDEGFIAFD